MNLPPKPDFQTGEPRPPSAPLQAGCLTPGDRNEAAFGKVRQPPADEGPMLEWFYPKRSTRVMAGVSLSLLLLVLAIIQFGGFSWMSNLWLWTPLVPWPFIFLFLGSFSTSAGADWAMHNRSFIKTYELTSVKVAVGGNAARFLDAKDARGNRTYAQISNLQQNHQLWDLVYNGILHSVHIGKAETNKRARIDLMLDFPPHLANTP